MRETTLRQRPLFEKRDAITNAIPGFWPHVLEDASSTAGFDEHVTPEDAEILTHITEIKVTRPHADKGDPRDIEVTFKVKDNDYMPAQTITKLFTYQPSDRPGLTGLVSTPTPIAWKENKDLTCGVGRAAIEAFEERRAKAASKDKKGKASAKLGPKEEALVQSLSKNSSSFFTWFSFTGIHRDLGEVEDDPDEFDQDDDDDMLTGPIEAFPYGDELAVQFAEDIYPSAVKYFSVSPLPSRGRPTNFSLLGASLEESDGEDEVIDLGSDIEEQLVRQTSHPGGAGGKHKHNPAETAGEPAKKRAKK